MHGGRDRQLHESMDASTEGQIPNGHKDIGMHAKACMHMHTVTNKQTDLQNPHCSTTRSSS